LTLFGNRACSEVSLSEMTSHLVGSSGKLPF